MWPHEPPSPRRGRSSLSRSPDVKQADRRGHCHDQRCGGIISLCHTSIDSVTVIPSIAHRQPSGFSFPPHLRQVILPPKGAHPMSHPTSHLDSCPDCNPSASRRDFIKTAVGGLAASAVSGTVFGTFARS